MFTIKEDDKGCWLCNADGIGIGPMPVRDASKFAAAIGEGVPIRDALRLLRRRVSMIRPAV